MKVAVVQKNSQKDWLARDTEFSYDLYGLCSDPNKKKIFKRDVDIEIDVDAYDWIILVGSEALSHFTKEKSVTDFSGKVVAGKYIPIISPAMLSFKPEAKPAYKEALQEIHDIVSGKKEYIEEDLTKYARGIQSTEEIKKFLRDAINYDGLDIFGIDSETGALYPRDGHMLGVSIAYCTDFGAYLDLDFFDEECEELLQELISTKTPVFHNAKFDIKFFEYHLNMKFPDLVHDTMLMHYNLDERQGTHGLKQLAIKYTKYGNYEQDLHDFIAAKVKELGIRKADFTWDYIPFETMYPYASIDALATLELALKFIPLIEKNENLKRVYYNILLPGMRFLNKIEENGVPFDKERLEYSFGFLQRTEQALNQKLRAYKEIVAFEETLGKEFNPNSTQQLRKLLFDHLGLKPTGIRTDKGEHSTNAEVLEILSKKHEVPALILELRKFGKIKNTYISKILPQLDLDGRLRTGFNLHMTTSGRLSSSGKLNLQQLPRDNPIVKGCLKARPGYKIVAMDSCESL